MIQNRFDYVVNLAAQAGVRYSVDNPRAYTHSNIDGFLSLLEGAKATKIGIVTIPILLPVLLPTIFLI